jgi:phosphodiesterase/alkaline phosphatase D-like protein
MPDPIRVGPIVGEVTATTARVVVQADRAAALRLRVVPAGSHAPFETEPQDLAAGEIAVFVLRELMPLHRYQFDVLTDDGPIADRSGRITTKSERPESLQVAAVSCNFTVRQGRARLWERLWDKWVGPGTIETVLHIGDQVYGDSAFEQALAEIAANGRSAAVARRIRAAFERLYGAAWNYPATRKVLANASNLMIWDDHEFRNSWGGLAEDKDADSDAMFVGQIARSVSQGFQSALWGEVVDRHHDAHAHAYGELGFVFLDQRSARSFSPCPQRPYLGVDQWAWLRKELRDGKLSTVRALMVIASVPLCFVSTTIASNLDWAMSDLRDQWSHVDHRTEMIEMLTEIRRWLEADPQRTVMLLGGDVHVGGFSRVEFRDGDEWRHLCDQLITSPITNAPPGALAWFGLRHLVLGGDKYAGPSYRFDHDESRFTNRRNFAVIRLRARDGEKAQVLGSLEIDGDD